MDLTPILGVAGIWWHALWEVFGLETFMLFGLATTIAYDPRYSKEFDQAR